MQYAKYNELMNYTPKPEILIIKERRDESRNK